MATKVCAHRGFSGKYPENTLCAIKAAVELGVEMIEFDVKLTKDYFPIIMHDRNVDRTTNGTGKVCDLTFEEIKALDAGTSFAPEYAGEKVPTLQEVLDIIPHGVLMNIHCASGSRVTEKVVNALLHANKLEFGFLATRAEEIKIARQIEPDVKVCNMTRQGQLEDYLAYSIELKADFIQFANRNLTANHVHQAHTHGITVNFFGANEEGQMQRLIDCGIDYILTDFPDRLIKVLAASDS